MSGGSLQVDNPYVGSKGSGQFVQSGGIISVGRPTSPTSAIGGELVLGNNSGDNGTYSLNGNGMLSSYYEYVGDAGTGSFTQSAGTNSVVQPNWPSTLYLGNLTSGSGTYSLTGTGLVLTDYTIIGYSGAGTFNQSGGTHIVTYLTLGNSTGSSGIYNLSGSGLLLASTGESIGAAGSGTFNQSGGTNSVAENLRIGGGAGSVYSMSGSGLLSVSGSEYLGYAGTGTFTQSGGTNLVGNALYLGYSNGGAAVGVYNLNGTGMLSASSEFVGARNGSLTFAGTFAQSGGLNAVRLLSIGTSGQYLFSGGTLQINGGISNNGIFDGGSGTGAVIAANSILDFSTGVLRNCQATSLNTDGNSLLILPSGTSPATIFGSYTGAALLHTVGTTLTVPAGSGFAGAGTINDPVVCQGTITAGPIGTSTFNSSVTISGTGAISLGNSGTLAIGNLTSGMSGGFLSAGYEQLGADGSGQFTQSGGTNTVSNGLQIGYNETGTYNLGGNALLSALYETVDYESTGIFNQTGGTNLVSSALYIGNDPGTGTYSLQGGKLVLPALYSNHPFPGTFNFSGGTLQASNSFSTSMSMTLGSSGGGATFDTGGYTVTLSGSLSGPGSLTKVDSGTLILSASNGYTGDTLVNAGTLILDYPDLAATSNAWVDDTGSGGILDLNYNGTDNISALYINGIAQSPGIWGGPGSGAPNTSSYLAGSGLLNVAVPEPSALALLASAIGVLGYGWRHRQFATRAAA